MLTLQQELFELLRLNLLSAGHTGHMSHWQHSPRWQRCPTVPHHGQETRAVMSSLEAKSQAGAARAAALYSSGVFLEVLLICHRTFSYCHPFSTNHVLLSPFSCPAGASLPSITPWRAAAGRAAQVITGKEHSQQKPAWFLPFMTLSWLLADS